MLSPYALSFRGKANRKAESTVRRCQHFWVPSFVDVAHLCSMCNWCIGLSVLEVCVLLLARILGFPSYHVNKQNTSAYYPIRAHAKRRETRSMKVDSVRPLLFFRLVYADAVCSWLFNIASIANSHHSEQFELYLISARTKMHRKIFLPHFWNEAYLVNWDRIDKDFCFQKFSAIVRPPSLIICSM